MQSLLWSVARVANQSSILLLHPKILVVTSLPSVSVSGEEVDGICQALRNGWSMAETGAFKTSAEGAPGNRGYGEWRSNLYS